MSDWKSDWWKLTLIGGGAGALGGLVGGGGDALIVPLLTLTKVVESYKLAIGTSLATLLPPVGIFAVLEYWRTKCKGNTKKKVSCVNWGYAMFLALMFTLGSWVVSHYAVDLEAHTLRMIYGGFLILLGGVIVLDEFIRKRQK
tara:strand:+ start:61 stop:489 length:429 start_codon:yes stop_codon:yes gene_type:complete